MLPPSLIPWILDQSESHLSAKYAQIDAVDATHTMLRPELVLQPIHESIIRRDMKNHLSELAPGIHDEVEHAMAELWGQGTAEFNSVNLDRTIREIVTRASNRAFIGLPICGYCEVILT